MNCPLCQTKLITKADDHYFICSTCKAYVKDSKFHLSAEQEKSRYEEHNNDVNDLGYQNVAAPIINTVLEKFTATHRGLDYGCGTGPVVSKLLKDKGYHLKLYDPYFYPDEDYLNHKYDYIFSCEVFEHFHQPARETEKLLDLLLTGGYLIFMTHLYDNSKDFRTWYYRNDPTHVFIFTESTILYLTEKYHLAVEILQERLIVLKKLPVEFSASRKNS